ncbi:MAG: DUF1501 domain-containing protein [Opitutae bacterium]|nr:DUF1501 domain-containing protein [Opitutae bacterium]
MIDLNSPHFHRNCEGFGRRDFLRVGGLAALGFTLADWFALQARAAGQPAKAPARSVIQLWMGGGPPHLDTFDPKPGAGVDYCGPLNRAIDTNVAGMRIGELLPLLAKQADKFSIIRSMTHGNNSHETAAYIMQTGTMPGDLVYPAQGAVVALKRAEVGAVASSLPPYITLTNPLGRFSECGFLGNNFRTFAPGGDPNAKEYRVQGLVPPRGMTDERIQERRSLVQAVDGLARQVEKQAALGEMDEFQEKAYGLLLGDAKKAFDLSAETEATRNRYGRTQFGQSCLLARRLVEHGVPFITVNSGGWDTHKNHFDAMKRLLPPLDQGFSALLEDLHQRGLLGSTIVTWGGEFGRTPKVAIDAPWFGGRHHFGAVFSSVVAGGGFKGGTVLGASDFRGENVAQRPVYPWDLAASIYTLLGIDPKGQLPHPRGCVAFVSPLASGTVPTGGLLKEIMA